MPHTRFLSLRRMDLLSGVYSSYHTTLPSPLAPVRDLEVTPAVDEIDAKRVLRTAVKDLGAEDTLVVYFGNPYHFTEEMEEDFNIPPHQRVQIYSRSGLVEEEIFFTDPSDEPWGHLVEGQKASASLRTRAKWLADRLTPFLTNA